MKKILIVFRLQNIVNNQEYKQLQFMLEHEINFIIEKLIEIELGK
jgi:hypothetical protein